jgi:hypothetical protein
MKIPGNLLLKEIPEKRKQRDTCRLTTFVELISRLKTQNDEIHLFDAPIYDKNHLSEYWVGHE